MDLAPSKLESERHVIEQMLARFPADTVVLDSPCGIGEMFQYYRDRGFIVIGMDTDKDRYRAAHELGDRIKQRGGIVAGNVLKPDLRDKTVDVTVSIGAIEQMTADDQAKFLAQLARVTRKDIIIDVPFGHRPEIEGWHVEAETMQRDHAANKAFHIVKLHPDQPYEYGAAKIIKNGIGVRIKRRYVLAELIRHHGWKSGAEIGVNRGGTTFYLLNQCPDFRIIAVDNWAFDNPIYGDMTEVRDAFMADATRYGDRCRVLYGNSVEMARAVPDGTLDFIFIDGDHSYDAVMADIRAWAPKVKVGGAVMGHDIDFPDVRRAVEDAYGQWMELDDDIWMVRRD